MKQTIERRIVDLLVESIELSTDTLEILSKNASIGHESTKTLGGLILHNRQLIKMTKEDLLEQPDKNRIG